MDDQSKCEIYTKLLNSLSKKCDLKHEIDKTTYSKQIHLLKIDLLSKVTSDQETALQLLEILIESNVQDIQKDVVSILSNECVVENIKVKILNIIQAYVRELLNSKKWPDLILFYRIWKSYDIEKVTIIEPLSLNYKQTI